MKKIAILKHLYRGSGFIYLGVVGDMRKTLSRSSCQCLRLRGGMPLMQALSERKKAYASIVPRSCLYRSSRICSGRHAGINKAR